MHAAEEAKSELKKRRLALAAEKEQQAQMEKEFNSIKFFDPAMLGQGKDNGGTRQHALARMDLMDRVKAKFPPLLPRNEVNYEQFKRRFDHVLSRITGYKGGAYGSFFLGEMKRLVNRRQAGHLDAFDVWMNQQINSENAIFGDFFAA